MACDSYDVVFKNARIVDGTNSPWYRGDVAVRDGVIVKIGALSAEETAGAGEVIDACGHVLAPGFIDVHTHSDFVLFRDSTTEAKLAQGVTTQVLGQCGLSAAPVSDQYLDILSSYSGFVLAGTDIKWNWHTFDDWLKELEKLKLGGNVAPCVGQGTIRIAVMGFDDRTATPEEMAKMKDMLREAMNAGCYGMTSGLVYPPGVYTPEAEMQELASVMSETGGIYLSHMRNESNTLLDSVRETIDVGRRSHIPVQISHHKALGVDNWGSVVKSLEMVDAARAEGVDVTIDQYPYTRSSTSIRSALPPWSQAGGVSALIERLKDPATRAKIIAEVETAIDRSKPCDWECTMRHCNGPKGCLVVYCPATPQWEGMNIQEIGEAMGKPPLEAACDIIVANDGRDAACYDSIGEDDLRLVLSHPVTMVGSDSIPPAPGAKAHPRSYGTNPRVLARYVRETKTLSLEDAVYKMTGLPAARFGFQKKGLIREGMDADLVLFDPDTVKDCATFADPLLAPAGFDCVFVAGQKVMDNGRYTGLTPGRVLRRGKN